MRKSKKFKNTILIVFLVIIILLVIVLLLYFLLQKGETYIDKKNNFLINKYIKFKPKIWFATYGTRPKYNDTLNRIGKEAHETGWFDRIDIYDQKSLSLSFKKEFWKVLELPRGAGYWIWKYDIIKKTMDSMNDGDIFVYADAGCKINKNGHVKFFEYIKKLRESRHQMLCFQMSYNKENVWTTNKIFEMFGISESDDKFRKSPQIMATSFFIQKGRKSEKWLNLILSVLRKDPMIITDIYNEETKKVNPLFQDNRHDQSITSVSLKIIGTLILKDDPESGKDDPHTPIQAKRCRTQKIC